MHQRYWGGPRGPESVYLRERGLSPRKKENMSHQTNDKQYLVKKRKGTSGIGVYNVWPSGSSLAQTSIGFCPGRTEWEKEVTNTCKKTSCHWNLCWGPYLSCTLLGPSCLSVTPACASSSPSTPQGYLGLTKKNKSQTGLFLWVNLGHSPWEFPEMYDRNHKGRSTCIQSQEISPMKDWESEIKWGFLSQERLARPAHSELGLGLAACPPVGIVPGMVRVAIARG